MEKKEKRQEKRTCGEWELNADLKIRLNLSDLALDVIEQDQLSFQAKSRTYFLNHIFLCAYRTSDASIARRLNEKREAFFDILKAAPIAVAQRDAAIKQLLKHECQQLKAKAESYKPAHKPFVHTISVAVIDLFDQGTFGEEAVYYSFPQYFRAVIEDYCRLPVLQREKLYFQEVFALIQCAIDGKKQLEVCSFSGIKYLVHPYKILSDPLCTAYYLACYARKKGKNIREKIPCSFRIANLRQLRLYHDNDAFLGQPDQKRLEDAISSQGAQFLTGQAEQICVRLTPQGIQKLSRYRTLRPICTEQTADGIYTFRCTEVQAEYYFLKLGADAQILSPASLRNKFSRMYHRAAENYDALEK